MKSISIIGGGSWGTALAESLAKKGFPVEIFLRKEYLAEKINKKHLNTDYFPDHLLSDKITATTSMKRLLDNGQFIFVAVPTQALSRVINRATPYIKNDRIIISTAKGIEENSFKRNSEIIKEAGFENVVVLSGPTHSEEVIKGLPSAAVTACSNLTVAEKVQKLLMSQSFRLYTSDDVIGVELAGAIKNIIAIASGTATGLGFGDNTRAALVTRGLAELRRFGSYFGGKKLTFSGLAGLGDLVVTCSSQKSRNFRCGQLIATGFSAEEAQKKISQVIEGIKTTRAVYKMQKKYNFDFELPITVQIYKVLFSQKSPLQAVNELMEREPKSELE